jgi:GDP/UDP-N,N'-diacetylbacillosamine 2-epimerase (hydrolysing)
VNTSARRIVYLTGTRADFGLMRSTLLRIAATPGLELSVLVTGMHLSAAHGNTIDEIRASGLRICAEVPVDMDTRSGESMSLGLADILRGVTTALARGKPDMLLLLGDRGEMLAGAIAALHLGIACVHIHGGERSGTVDEPVRHAISKLATWHLVATPGSRERLVRMGEDPSRIHVTGAPGLDDLLGTPVMPRADCLAALGLAADAQFVLAVFHPVVQQAGQAAQQTQALAGALAAVGLPVVWMAPNADAGSREILQALDATPLPSGSLRITHLARPVFTAALAHAQLLAGNSSSGIIEAASFGTPVVNVGDRQSMRERNTNVIDTPAEAAQIAAAVATALQRGRGACDNVWGDGKAGERIAGLLASLPTGGAVLEKVNTY